MTIWLDRLDAVSVLCLIRRLMTAGHRLCYLNATPTGLKLLQALTRTHLLRSEVNEVGWNLGDLKDKDGRSLRFSVEQGHREAVASAGQVLRRVVDEMSRSPFVRLPRLWLVNSLEFGLLQTYRLHLTALMVVEALVRSDDEPRGAGRAIVLIRWLPFNEDLTGFGEKRGLDIQTYGGFVLGVVGPSVALVEEIARSCYQVVRAGLRVRVGCKGAGRTAGPRVALQYCWGVDETRRNDLYWHDGARLDAEHVLFYFDRSDSPLTSSLRDELDRRRLGWVVRARAGCGIPGMPVWHPSLRDRVTGAEWIVTLVLEATLWPRLMRFGDWVWLLAWAIAVVRDVNYWRSFFAGHGVVAHTNHSGLAGVTHSVQSLALQIVGGLNFRTTYSYHSILNPRESGDFHVFFAWGRCAGSSPGVLQYHRRSKHIVVTGYPFDGRGQGTLTRGDLLSLAKASPGTRLLGAFDEAVARYSEYSRSIWDGFYGGLTALALSREDILVLMKPKDHTAEEIIDAVDGLDEAIKVGRVVILGHETNAVEVGRNVDLVIGLGISTPSIEAAMFGVPALHYDPARRKSEQLIEEGRGGLVHQEWDSLLVPLERFLDEDPVGVGDHAEVVGEIDPFRDGRSAARIRAYMSHYFAHRASGTGLTEAIAFANQVYQGEWGDDKVWDNEI